MFSSEVIPDTSINIGRNQDRIMSQYAAAMPSLSSVAGKSIGVTTSILPPLLSDLKVNPEMEPERRTIQDGRTNGAGNEQGGR